MDLQDFTLTQIKELCRTLDLTPRELQDTDDYMVLTDDEADATARQYIEDSLWAFNTSFLMSHVKENITEECLDALKSQYEDSNAAIKELIEDFDHFVEDAISCDGRGHFISSYDGCETELDSGLYLYRLH